MYSDVPAGANYRARSLGQRVIAFVIKIDTAKLACGVVLFCTLTRSTVTISPHLGNNR